MIRVVPVGPEHLEARAGLFAASESACFCNYWHFAGTKNDWLERCAVDPNANRVAFDDYVRAGDPRGGGLLAFSDASPKGTAIGWVKLTPRNQLSKLRNLSVYRPLDLGPDETVFSIGCFLVDPAHRHSGVARALLAGATPHAIRCGATLLEAYPRRTDNPLHDEEAWMGPHNIFIADGFVPVYGHDPYPVLQKKLT